MNQWNHVAENIKRVREGIDNAVQRAGRNPAEVRLMTVSKFFPHEAVKAAWDTGQTLFGESRVQEAAEKFTGLQETLAGVELHLIGALQRNKAKRAVAMFDMIQSLDRDELIDTLGELTITREKPLMVLLELNSGEAQKSGYRSVDDMFRAVERLLGYPGLALRGLMTVAPWTDDAGAVRSAFQRLAKAQTTLKQAFPELDVSVLSMGMSGDYTIAIEEGSTLVRIGTAIFGERH